MIRILAGIGLGCVFLFFIIMLACLMAAAEVESLEEQAECVRREMEEKEAQKQKRAERKRRKRETRKAKKLPLRARAPIKGHGWRNEQEKGGEDNEPGTAD